MSIADILQSFVHGADLPLPENRCFFECLARVSGMVNEKAAIDISGLGAVMDGMPVDSQNLLLRIVSKCISIKNKNVCERMYVINVCLRRTDPARFFL